MRLHRLIRQSITSATALAAMACILLALAATAGAVPGENVGRQKSGSCAVATPTVVKETVVRPSDGTDAIVFVLIGVGAVVATLGAGYLGARIATRTTHARPTDVARADPPRSPSPAPPFPPFERGGRGDPARIDVPSRRAP